MACGGHCNVCPAHPGYDPPVYVISWPDPGLGTDITVRGYYHFYYLNYYINQEFTRRSVSPPGDWVYGQKYTDDIIYAADYRMLVDGLDACDPAWTPNGKNLTNEWLSAGMPILDESTLEMRDQVDILRAECLCDCNYACTCNCNYCTCNCNYACTCDCNYSDRRLKDNIKYL